MDAMMTAIGNGDYAQAYEALQATPEASTPGGAAAGAVLLALTERWDQAEQLLAGHQLEALQVIVRGERERAARFGDPACNGSLNATADDPRIPLYVAIGAAFVHDNEELADKAKAELAQRAQPVRGKLTFDDGTVRPFGDLADADDAIGHLLDTYCGDGLLYFPLATLRRVEVLPKRGFIDLLMPRIQVTDTEGTANAYLPLLYAGSARSPDAHLRTGQRTVFIRLGQARRGQGQRGFQLDGAGCIGLHDVTAIDFD